MSHRFKKFIVFDVPEHYPSGGLDDIVDSFDTIEEASFASYQHSANRGHQIVDRDTWEEVERLPLRQVTRKLEPGEQLHGDGSITKMGTLKPPGR